MGTCKFGLASGLSWVCKWLPKPAMFKLKHIIIIFQEALGMSMCSGAVRRKEGTISKQRDREHLISEVRGTMW